MAHFTNQEEDYIRKHYLTRPMKQIARELNRSHYGTRYHALTVMKLAVPEKVKKTFKKLYEKGHVPFTKGKRVQEFLTDEQIENFKPHWFKEGNQPKNKRVDGTITIRINKLEGIPYKWIRVKSSWIQLSRYNWLAAGNDIPKGYILTFKDGNTMNCDAANLECISRADNLKRNRQNFVQAPPCIRADTHFRDRVKNKRLRSKNREARAFRETIKREEARRIAKLKKERELHRQRVARAQEKKLCSVTYADELRWSKKQLRNKAMVIPDNTGRIPVRVDHKTTIYVKPGSNITEILKHYQKKAS